MLSLIIYSLLLVISVKYIAHRDARRQPGRRRHPRADRAAAAAPRAAGSSRSLLVLLGIFGAALLYGDGMITPAITVLGAVEGLKVATPLFEPYVVPITVVILIRRLRDSAARHATASAGCSARSWWSGSSVIAVLGVMLVGATRPSS